MSIRVSKEYENQLFFFFSSRRRHTRQESVSWARRCVQETGVHGENLRLKSESEQHKRRGMSKFFVNAEDVEESDEEVLEEEQKNVESRPAPVQKRAPAYDSDDDDDDRKGVMRPEKEKRFGILKEIVKRIVEKIKINDFQHILTDFDELNKQLEKSKRVIEKEGIPLTYVRTCYVLENLCNNFSEEEKKKLKTQNANAFKLLKQKVKKNNKNYQKQLDEFAKNPTFSDADDQGSDDDKPSTKKVRNVDADDNDDDDTGKKGSKFFGGEDGEEDEDSIVWDEDEESEESDEDDEFPPASVTDPAERRKYWLVKDKEQEREEGRERRRAEKEKEAQRKRERALAKKAKETSKTVVHTQVERRAQEYTSEAIGKRLKEIAENRATKKTNFREYIDLLEDLFVNTNSELRKLEILMVLITIRFDFAKDSNMPYMSRELWQNTLENLNEYLKLLKSAEMKFDKLTTYIREVDQSSNNEAYVYDSFFTHYEALDGELQKAFRNLEYLPLEYAERLKDECDLIRLAKRAQEFFEPKKDHNNITRLALKRLEHLYYINDETLVKLRQAAQRSNQDFSDEYYAETKSQELIHTLATNVYTNKVVDDKSKIKAMLYHIYHHCIHNRYTTARDYLLMTHIPEHIQSCDVHMQILYNRTLAQLGLCAFRLGLIQEAHQTLSEICGPKLRLLLAQGLNRQHPDKDEKRRLVPYHMHIDTDMLEAVHLTSAMLLEIPNLAADPNDNQKKVISKNFRKLLEIFERNYFNSPPENFRDYIYAASQELTKGNWRKCYDYLISMKLWDDLYEADKAKENLLVRVKEQAFKCFLFSFKNCFDSLSCHHLAQVFELDVNNIRSTVCKLIHARELNASLYDKSQYLSLIHI
eukprot:TRINITY_DN1540_c0_g1_i1.p1 TRINITY_DN1540_c0_g1~~TRINITY_DN1540_c0_g1_i1.p1  ORF type:complete len:871 (-),score=366.55 TRINITY_DN1540_c0_g1_i1:74-2686(-)